MDCLIIGKVWPEPTSTAAGRRTNDVITALQLGCWQVHFASAAQRGEHALDLEAIGVTTHEIAVNDAAFDPWVKALAPQVVIFDRFMTEEQYGWRVAQRCPDALRVLDTSDLHSLRLAREQVIKSGEALKLKNDMALREIAAIYRSDLTLMISEFEMEILVDEFGINESLLAYWPFSLELSQECVLFENRKDFILIGSFSHRPNLDAVRWCKAEIWPLIRQQLPEAELHCYGSYGDRFAAELHAPKNGFYFKGRTEDALATMTLYRVNLAPLRYGAGLKGKVFDGFQTGTPSVMTPIAAEGISTNLGWAHTAAEDFANAALQLYREPEAWRIRQCEERALCQDRFNSADWLPRLAAIMQCVIGEKVQLREQNFIGKILRHHQHRSTEFMSRWIELKNK